MPKKDLTKRGVNFLRFLVPVFILAGFFICAGSVKAVEYVDQYKLNPYNRVIANHTMEQSFVPQQNNISRFTISGVYDSAVNPLTADVVLSVCADYSCENILGQQSISVVNARELVFQPTAPISLIPGNTYWMKIYSSKAFRAGGGNKSDRFGNYSQDSALYVDDVFVWWIYGRSDILIFSEYYNDSYVPPPDRNPVIIVPGIIASYLNNATTSDEFLLGEEVWPNIEKMKGMGDNYLDYLKLDETNKEIKHIIDPVKILKELEGNDFFAGLIQELKNNGYEEEKDLFAFPYDWRLNLNWTAGDSPYPWQQTLKQKVEKVKSDTGAQKVDIIAHSMGGLVVKNY
jgi:hypothetical protein